MIYSFNIDRDDKNETSNLIFKQLDIGSRFEWLSACYVSVSLTFLHMHLHYLLNDPRAFSV